MFYHLSGDLGRVTGFGICRGTFFVSGPENFQFNVGAGFRVQFFNLQILTGFNPVLFSTSFNIAYISLLYQIKRHLSRPLLPCGAGPKGRSPLICIYIIT